MSAVRETPSFMLDEGETGEVERPNEIAQLLRAAVSGSDEPQRFERETPVETSPPAHAIALAVGQLTIDAAPTDWTRTLTLVERTAATIRAYEKRFLQLEKQSKALADRAAEDQHRLQSHITAMEERLRQSEERVMAAETAARDAEYHEWEAEMRAKRAEQRALEAEAKYRQTEAYLRRVHELLSGVS